MSLFRKFIPIFLLALLLIFPGCNESNPLSPLSDDNHNVSIEINDGSRLSATVRVTNATDFEWKQVDLTIIFEEINSGKKHTHKFEFGELKINYRNNAALLTSTVVQKPLCYTYYLSVNSIGYNKILTNEGGTCS